jgi:hypothetical protein
MIFVMYDALSASFPYCHIVSVVVLDDERPVEAASTTEAVRSRAIADATATRPNLRPRRVAASFRVLSIVVS